MPSKYSELEMVRYLKQILNQEDCPNLVKGVGDDTAVVKIAKNKYMLLTSDMLIEGRHFRDGDSLFDVGRKAVNCSLSDIASMGGVASYALVSLGLPKKFSGDKLKRFKLLYRGLRQAAEKNKVIIVGGDINSSRVLIVDVTVVGFVSSGKIVYRDGAKAGDCLFVTGELGGSIRGRHLIFNPRTKEAQFLVNRFKINSMIDVSDGLLVDLQRILDASRVGAVLFESCIPIHKDAKDLKDSLCMGEDFELLFSVSEKIGRRLIQMSLLNKIDFPLSFIGKLVSGKPKIWLIDNKRRPKLISPEGFLHFR